MANIARKNNKLNVSGGFYKTQIDIEDIIIGMQLEDIKHLAKNPTSQSFEMFEPFYPKERDWLVDIWEQTEEMIQAWRPELIVIDSMSLESASLTFKSVTPKCFRSSNKHAKT